MDEPERLASLMQALGAAHRLYRCPVVVTTHPRTRQRLERFGLAPEEGVTFHRPFGFLDWVKLQQHALCVLSDSGTVSEESAILGFPAVTLRDAIERPEAVETGGMITTGVNADVVVDAIGQVVAQRRAGEQPPLPEEYRIHNFSQRVANFIRATAHAAHAWAGMRPRSPVFQVEDAASP